MTTTTSGLPLPDRHTGPPPSAADSTPDATGTTGGRLIGALFVAGFVTYGTGFALASSMVNKPDFLTGLPAHQITLVLGAFLMLSNTAVDIGKGVLFPILEPHGKRTALTYLSTMIFEVALLAVGALSLLVLVPLAGQLQNGQINTQTAQPLGSLAVDVTRWPTRSPRPD